MKRPLRRLTFQVTPLLDLLLIVIFAQFMEMRETSNASARDLASRRDAMIEEQQAMTAELQQQQLALQQQREELNDAFQSIVDQHERAGDMLVQGLNLRVNIVEELLRIRTSGNEADAARLEQAAADLQHLISARGAEVFRELLRFDEMQKRCSIWELHLEQNGDAVFYTGTRAQRFDFGNTDEFQERLFLACKSVEEPRTLVIISISYGDAQLQFRRVAEQAMPGVVQMLRQDAGNRRWYDFSLLGYRPEGPILISPP